MGKKRFTDTGLHKKPWFRQLRSELRESWRILCAECDEIGVWEVDLEGLNFSLNLPSDSPYRVRLEELVNAFELQMVGDDKLFIPGFVAFQYGDEEGKISPRNKLLPKLVRMLKARNLPLPILTSDAPQAESQSPSDPPCMGDASPCHGVKEEEEEKEQVKDLEKKGSAEGKMPDAPAFTDDEAVSRVKFAIRHFGRMNRPAAERSLGPVLWAAVIAHFGRWSDACETPAANLDHAVRQAVQGVGRQRTPDQPFGAAAGALQ